MKKIVIITVTLILIITISVITYLYKDPKIAVLCYHNIATIKEKESFPEEKDWVIDVENFEEHLKYLKEHNYKTLTINEFIQWKQGKINLPYKSVLITFDDGFLSNYQYAFPLLKKYNMNAVVFLIGNYMQTQKTAKWDGNIKQYMNLEIIEKAKQEYKNIEFASHSLQLHYHNSINEKTKEELINDLNQFSKSIVNTKAYAYPFGAYNSNMIDALEQANYEIAFIYGPTKKEYRKASRKDDIYKIPRLNVSYGMSKSKFGLRLILPF